VFWTFAGDTPTISPMAGTQTTAEGLPSFRVSTILEGSAPQNSLESGFSISNLQQGAQVWVDDEKSMFRWDEDSTATDDGATVVTPTGVTGAGRFIKVGSPADVGASILLADTLAALNALPAFSATSVFLRGLNAVGDGAGGVFAVITGGTAAAYDLIALSGVHVPKQIARLENFFAEAYLLLFDAGAAITIASPSTPVQVTQKLAVLAAGPWDQPNNYELRWLGRTTSEFFLSYTLNFTGTAGDRIQAKFGKNSSFVLIPDPIVTLDASGYGSLTLAQAPVFLNFNATLSLSVQNLTAGRNITPVYWSLALQRIPANTTIL